MIKKANTQLGFTLLEMLISIALFAVMAAMAYTELSQIIRSSTSINQSNQTLSELQFSFAQIENDVMQLSQRKIRDEYGDEHSSLVIEDSSLVLSRSGWNNFIGAQRSEVQRVEYHLKDNEMMRHYWLTLDRVVGQEAIQASLLTGVTNVSFALLDSSGKRHSSWPLESNEQTNETGTVVAKALEVTLELEQWGEVKKLIELVDDVL